MSEPVAGSATEIIVSTPGTCGGKPRVAGHRIRVQDIVIWTGPMGMTVDEIVSSYPGMDLKEEEELADQLETGPDIEIVELTGMVDAGTHPNPPGREL